MSQLPIRSFIFLLTSMVLCSVALLAVPNSSTTQPKPDSKQECSKVRQQIQRYADDDVLGGRAFNDGQSAVTQFKEIAKSCMTTMEIQNVYRDEYILRKTHWWDRLPPQYYAVLIVLAIFWRSLKTFAEENAKKGFEALYARYSGATLFRGRSLAFYRKAILRIHEEFKVPFRELPLKMRNVYVPLKLSESTIPVDAREIVRSSKRLVVKGVPGAGKSMLLRALLLSYADKSLGMAHTNVVPVLVELSRLNPAGTSLLTEIVAVFDKYSFPKATNFVNWALERNSLLLLLDGLDEVNSTERTRVVAMIVDLVDKYDCSFVVTCRTQVYQDELQSVADITREVAEFADIDIFSFLGPWEHLMGKDRSVSHLMKTLRERPRIHSLARNPLLLTMIAYLYSDKQIEFPHSRAEFYRVSTDLLLDKWQGLYNRYKLPAKSAVVTRLALRFQENPATDQDRRSLDHQEVLAVVRAVLPGTTVPLEESGDLIDELVDRSGILLRIDGGTRYQFAHLTMQEYFAATALSDRRQHLFDLFKQDRDTWREVVKLWCGTTQDASEMVRKVASEELTTALECLADAKFIKPDIADLVVAQGKAEVSAATARLDEVRRTIELSKGGLDEMSLGAMAKAFGLVASVPGMRGVAIREWLNGLLSDQISARETFATFALVYSNSVDAATSLARHGTPGALIALSEMGDVAVGPIVALKKPELLMAIRTPRALSALARLLWEADEVSLRTAGVIAFGLPDPVVEGLIGKIPISELGGLDGMETWVLEPLESMSPSVARIIARCVALIARFPEVVTFPLEDMVAVDISAPMMDPRIILPAFTDSQDKLLLRVLPLGIQIELENRLKNMRPPERQDWLNVFNTASFYSFRESSLGLCLKLLLPIIPLGWAVCVYWSWFRAGWWNLGAGFYVGLFSIVLIFCLFERSVGKIPLLVLLNPWAARTWKKSLMEERLRFPLIEFFGYTWMPLFVLYFTWTMSPLVPWGVTLPASVATLVWLAVVVSRAYRRERVASNPLQGLISLEHLTTWI